MSSVELFTAPAATPVSISEAKDHERIDETAEDTLIDGLIGAATQYVQTASGRQLITATFKYRIDRFPMVIILPRAPVLSVTSIKYNDSNGDVQTLAASKYTTDLNRLPSRIVPAFGDTWPNTQGHIDDVTVEFVAGYGTNGSDVAAHLRAAVMQLTAHLYTNRGVAVEKALTSIPMTFHALIDTDRVWYGGR